MKTIKIKVSDNFNADENEVVIIPKDGISEPCERCGGETVLIGMCVDCESQWTLNEHISIAEVVE
jgi:hypothetical protein